MRSRTARLPRALGLAAVLALVVPALLRGQDAAGRSRPPLRPDSVLAPGPGNEGFAAWRAGIAARGRTGASYLVEDGRYQVLLLTPMAIDALAQDSLVVQATKGCQRALALSDAQVEWTRGLRPWAAFDSAAYARPLVAIAVYPQEQRRYDCHAGTLARFAALARGALYGAFFVARPQDQVAMVEVRRDGLVEEPALAGRAPVTKVTHTRIIDADGSEQLRVWLDPLAFAPDAEGRVPRLEVHVFNPVDPEPDILPLPEPLIRAVWQQMLPWQARLLDVAGAARTPVPFGFPAPTDSALRAAHEAFERGDLGAAASGALTRLMFRPRPPQAEIRTAMLESAVAFSMRERDAEALFLITDVMEVYPCLTFAPEVPAALREMAAAAAKPARCTAIPLPLIAARSLVPGWGQATSPNRRRLALTVLASTTASYATAAIAHDYAERKYEAYRAYAGGGFPSAESRYKVAQQARIAGNVMSAVAASLWVGAGLEALWHEHRFAQRLAEVREVGQPAARSAGRRVSLAPVLVPSVTEGRVGFAVRF